VRAACATEHSASGPCPSTIRTPPRSRSSPVPGRPTAPCRGDRRRSSRVESAAPHRGEHVRGDDLGARRRGGVVAHDPVLLDEPQTGAGGQQAGRRRRNPSASRIRRIWGRATSTPAARTAALSASEPTPPDPRNRPRKDHRRRPGSQLRHGRPPPRHHPRTAGLSPAMRKAARSHIERSWLP
jgi:hypothetical protein